MDHQKTGTLIAARRNELGLTQKELAKQLNISDRTVSKWERGADNIYVDYSFGKTRTILSFIYDGSITKTCSQSRDSIYGIENRNNETFAHYDFS